MLEKRLFDASCRREYPQATFNWREERKQYLSLSDLPDQSTAEVPLHGDEMAHWRFLLRNGGNSCTMMAQWHGGRIKPGEPHLGQSLVVAMAPTPESASTGSFEEQTDFRLYANHDCSNKSVADAQIGGLLYRGWRLEPQGFRQRHGP
jgi:hypothetical protein